MGWLAIMDHDAGVGDLGIADQTGLVDVLVSEPDVGDGHLPNGGPLSPMRVYLSNSVVRFVAGDGVVGKLHQNIINGSRLLGRTRWKVFAFGRLFRPTNCDFPPLLRSIVFVGETPLGSRLDVQRGRPSAMITPRPAL